MVNDAVAIILFKVVGILYLIKVVYSIRLIMMEVNL